MKNRMLLNSRLSGLIAEQGHTDEITLSDAGLPVPEGPERIDLAVSAGVPGIADVLGAALSELVPEAIVLAEEAQEENPEFLRIVDHALKDAISDHWIRVEHIIIPHDQFKLRTAGSRAVVRTGECRPFANIILVSGVAF